MSIKSLPKEQIIEKYIPLVKYIASRVILGKSKHLEYEELIACGMVGLMDAFNKFDESKGMQFSTYASIRIRGAMIDEIRKNSPISKGAIDKLNRYNDAVQNLQNKLMREPSNEEISKELNMSFKEIGEIENYINYISVISLENAIYSEDEEVTFKGLIEDKNSPSPERIYEEKEEIKLLEASINKLNERDKTVLSLYYYEELTLKEIGKVLEVSESRVCQLHSRAIANLRKEMQKLYIR
ncbi:FliA/WhiG family RNA polymerase sigma factor [Inconstantimicrobium mannanitabidum]|uniref:RNA polymerase sigma factor n=1 Tax=Inconstantimicrobium mannanitabidum TaxID=1604901 RepID=A0ACB5R8Z5_9CLOT|nr:FliA/WhiG family RNA polymerase sigma factor [Clostridium sp. TW13]GKX65507.1 RNA polymerase sigma factor [Clostridium sp. TW13]